MGNKIWGVLAQYEGLWVAMDRQGKVVADHETLAGVISAAGQNASRLTFVFAAPESRGLVGNPEQFATQALDFSY